MKFLILINLLILGSNVYARQVVICDNELISLSFDESGPRNFSETWLSDNHLNIDGQINKFWATQTAYIFKLKKDDLFSTIRISKLYIGKNTNSFPVFYTSSERSGPAGHHPIDCHSFIE